MIPNHPNLRLKWLKRELVNRVMAGVECGAIGYCTATLYLQQIVDAEHCDDLPTDDILADERAYVYADSHPGLDVAV